MKNRSRIIKRYQNRKLYDTLLSRYITLDDLGRMIKNGEDIVVIDNKTEKDITSATLTQLIFETEKKSKGEFPITTLRDIIRTSGGSISHFFQKTVKTGAREIQKRFESVTGISDLNLEISKLEQEVRALETRLEKYEQGGKSEH
jgi:polyhydroxyalkanoate synthesis repressor PhaR